MSDTPSQAQESFPPRAWISLRVDGGLTHIALFRNFSDVESIAYMSVAEHTALCERREAEGRANMLKDLSDEIDAMGCDKAMVSVRHLMIREEKIRKAARGSVGVGT